MTSIVQLNQLSKGFYDGSEHHLVLNQLNLSLEQGQAIALTGPSGSGKSTLLNLMAGFETADSGDLLLLGESTQQWGDQQWSAFRRQSLGVIFQQFNLLTPLNVEDNIRFPLQLLGLSWNDWCEHLLDALGITALRKRHVEQLSGGQQQRVAIARALAHRPRLLLADEPTGNLDETAAMQVMELLSSLCQEANASILMVTHSPQCAAFMPHQWRLHLGQIEQGTRDVLPTFPER